MLFYCWNVEVPDELNKYVCGRNILIWTVAHEPRELEDDHGDTQKDIRIINFVESLVMITCLQVQLLRKTRKMVQLYLPTHKLTSILCLRKAAVFLSMRGKSLLHNFFGQFTKFETSTFLFLKILQMASVANEKKWLLVDFNNCSATKARYNSRQNSKSRSTRLCPSIPFSRISNLYGHSKAQLSS